jgi:hypothetical protein
MRAQQLIHACRQFESLLRSLQRQYHSEFRFRSPDQFHWLVGKRENRSHLSWRRSLNLLFRHLRTTSLLSLALFRVRFAPDRGRKRTSRKIRIARILLKKSSRLAVRCDSLEPRRHRFQGRARGLVVRRSRQNLDRGVAEGLNARGIWTGHGNS